MIKKDLDDHKHTRKFIIMPFYFSGWGPLCPYRKNFVVSGHIITVIFYKTTFTDKKI